MRKKATPAELDSIEEVLATGGENCKQTMQHTMPWWQLSLLDVKLLLMLACIVLTLHDWYSA